MKQKFTKAAAIVGIAFALASSPGRAGYIFGAHDYEPYKCKINGRVYAPKPSSIIVDVKSGLILAGNKIDEPRPPASMTKIMTLALIFDALRDGRLALEDEITVRLSQDVLKNREESDSTWMEEGETLTVEEAILAIAVASANNISILMAERLAGSEAAFSELMNEKAQEIGMTRTVFTNASGLPDNKQISTARDIAKLALYVRKEYPEYYHYFSEPTAEFGTWRGKKRMKHNHNELAVRNDEIDGLKTGYTCDSGFNVAVTAVKGESSVISVVFGGRTPYRRNLKAEGLIRKAFSLLQSWSQLGSQPVSKNGYEHIKDDEKIQNAEKDNNLASRNPAL